MGVNKKGINHTYAPLPFPQKNTAINGMKHAEDG
jgi:hypothetical protein